MILGIVWPAPGPLGTVDPALLAHIREATGATHLRFNLDCRHPDPQRVVADVRAGGFEPLPILDFEYGLPIDLELYASFCVWVVEACELPIVELLNEPRILDHWTGTEYGHTIAPVCERLRSRTQVILAGDYLIPDREGPKILDVWMHDACTEVPEDWYQAVAWHPYREPAAPEITRHASRQAEYEAMVAPLPPGTQIHVTEVGWNLHEVTQAQQAEYLVRELDINLALGIAATYIYAGPAGTPDRDFGLFNTDLTPRPAAIALREWQQRHR